MYKSCGITLLELIITLSIIVALSLISIPLTQHLYISAKISTSKHDLLTILQTAKSAAINQNSNVVLCPSKDASHCSNDWMQKLYISRLSLNKMTIKKAHTVHVYAAIKKGSLQFKAFPKSHYLVFTPMGFTDHQNGTFSYCYQHQGWKIVVNQAARFKIVDVEKC